MSKPIIKVRPGGPYDVTGPIEVVDGEGKVVRQVAEGEIVNLCRCGKSKNKPFCDGSHRQGGWE